MLQIYNLIGESLRVCEGFYLSSLEPTENYFSWVVVRYGIGKSYLKGIHTSPSEYYVITKDLKKE